MNKLSQGVGNLKTFFREVKIELLKCTWPTRKELFGQSLVVIISVIILGAFVGLCDLVNMGLLRFIIHEFVR
jgi:preprotein translocase subunit SecE